MMLRDNQRIALLIVGWLSLFILAMALSGCGSEVRPPAPIPPEPSIAEQLRSLGRTFLWWGGIVMGLGGIIRIVIWGASFLTLAGPAGIAIGWIAKWLGPLVGLAWVCGAAGVATGMSFIWLADYLWAVVCAAILTAMACGVWFYPRILRRIRAWQASWKAISKR